MSDTMARALLQGQMAVSRGNIDLARQWVERAAALEPTGAIALLVLAGAKLMLKSDEATELYAHVAKEHDLREAWLGLAAACYLQGEGAQAADALGRAFGRHAVPTTDLAFLADGIVYTAYLSGWCALESRGHLAIRLASEHTLRLRLNATIDGRRIALHSQTDGRCFTARLPKGWQRGCSVAVKLGEKQLLGSPLEIGAISRVEGFADTMDGDLHGWAWCPNYPECDPVLSVVPLDGKAGITTVANHHVEHVEHRKPLARPRGFHIPAALLRKFDGPVRVFGHDGRNLTGSPLDPSAERRSAEAASGMVARLFPASARTSRTSLKLMPLPAVPAHLVGNQPSGGSTKRPVDVVVPVYGEIELTLACIESVLADLPRWARVVVVDDASPEPSVARELSKLAASKYITLLAQKVNRGFPSTANIGMRYDTTRDVVLLNSDTLTPPGWLARLLDAAYSAPEIGSATPLSNDATIVSYPSVDHMNAIPGLDSTIQLDALAQTANSGLVVDIPTAIGFCVYIKRDCLQATGLFREDLFAQGYGEENDFCIRARHLGWRHVAVPNVFVAHVGGQSFGATKQYLIERNLRVLNRLHPGYDTLIHHFQSVDPMAEPRRRLDIERWKRIRTREKSVLLITHGRTGGVQRRVAERAAALRAEGVRPIVLWPVASRVGGGRDCVLGNGPEGGTPNLRFAIPAELKLLGHFLKADRPLRAEVHHLIGHDHRLLDLFRQLDIPYEVIIHDYSWLCPRINLVGPTRRYCGEPDVADCELCVADVGTTNDENIGPRGLRERSAHELGAASRIVVPSKDAATRVERHFPGRQPEVVLWEDETTLPPPNPLARASESVRRVCVVGAISIEKGFEVLLACARDAANRKLNLEFRLVGYSCDDDRLIATRCVHITGRYEEQEAVALIRAQKSQVAWLPSLWPETWCYTLTQAWQAGLNVLAFDIGAQAERIRRTGRGWLIPLGLPASTLNNRLLALQTPGVR
jgi:GT2 family glycosyltransferase